VKALNLIEPGRFSWTDAATPEPAPDEALVRVRRCGVCGTDLHAIAGRQPFFAYPRRLGHELCVEIIKAPSGSGLTTGGLYAVEPYLSCGSCPACRCGRTNCCQSLQVLGVHIDGGHAQEITIPAARLHRAASLMPDEIALVEPLVIGAHAVERAALRIGEPALIIGMGPIGLAVAIFAKAAGANVACSDLDPARLDFACSTMGLGTPIPADGNIVRGLRDHFHQLPSVIIDATGSPASMKQTFDLAEHAGRIVFVGLFPGEMCFDDPNFHRRELTLMASRAGRSGTFREVIRLMEHRRIDALPLITHRFGFAEAAGRLPSLHREHGLVKAMIDFD
jgi:2-desacetyl-2-hydroxyethyl bacteriochlorophyllide A dehydrogenase